MEDWAAEEWNEDVRQTFESSEMGFIFLFSLRVYKRFVHLDCFESALSGLGHDRLVISMWLLMVVHVPYGAINLMDACVCTSCLFQLSETKVFTASSPPANHNTPGSK